MPQFNTPALPCWHCHIHVHTYTCKYLSVVTIVCYLCTHNTIQTIMQCTQHIMKLCYLTCVGSETRRWSTPVLLQWISSRTTRSSGTTSLLSKCNPAMGWRAVWEYKRRCNVTQVTTWQDLYDTNQHLHVMHTNKKVLKPKESIKKVLWAH